MRLRYVKSAIVITLVRVKHKLSVKTVPVDIIKQRSVKQGVCSAVRVQNWLEYLECVLVLVAVLVISAQSRVFRVKIVQLARMRRQTTPTALAVQQDDGAIRRC